MNKRRSIPQNLLGHALKNTTPAPIKPKQNLNFFNDPIFQIENEHLEANLEKKREYYFRNKICPVCKKKVDMYHYTMNSVGEKIHLECDD